MINKSFIIILFCYAISISLISAEYMVLIPMGYQLTAPDGTPLNAELVALIDTGSVNSISENIIDTNYDGEVPGSDDPFNRIFDFNPAMAYTVFQIAELLSGTYIFHILTLFGVPIYLVSGITILYLFFLARTIAGMLRGF